jgi:hypothetical protein
MKKSLLLKKNPAYVIEPKLYMNMMNGHKMVPYKAYNMLCESEIQDGCHVRN